MAEGQFILYIRKVIVNPLLGRKQMVGNPVKRLLLCRTFDTLSSNQA